MNDAQTYLDLAIWLPIPFAFFVLGLMVLLRGENRFAGMLAPFLMVVVGTILYVPLALYIRQSIELDPDMDFLLRRTSESFADVVIGVPVLFAFGVLGLTVLLRRERRFAGMLVPFLVVTVLSVAYVPLALAFKPYFSWWVILIPLLIVALVYVVLMYLKDAQTIAPGWAAFLGLLRCAVYGILAFVFLLPGCQSYEKNEYPSKVIFLFDVSGSMNWVDDFPEVGQDPASLPTRQDKVIQLLTSQAELVQKVLQKSPITAYRFGAVADEIDVLHLEEGRTLNAAEWAVWLKPDKKNIKVDKTKPEEDQLKDRARLGDLIDALTGGTNVGGAALQVAKAESGSFVQAIVIFSDGQSNVGSDDALREFAARVNTEKRKIHVFTVGVGDYRQPVSIRIDDLQAPEIARPDDKFPVRVPVVGTGLADEDFDVALEMTRVEDGLGRPVAGGRTIPLGSKKGKFKGGGDHPNDTVEFEIDIQQLEGLKSVDDKAGALEGTWQFVAKVPRHRHEANFTKAEHASAPPTRVLVQKKKLRILLVAGGAGRDYQFVRTLLYREVNEKRVDLSVFLQTGREDHVDQDVESDRLLARFPDTLGPSKEKYMSLSDYDVIVAFDADWTALDVSQLKMVKDWVGTHAGGIIFVAGPVHTFHLARPGGLDLSSLQTIFPVVLRDSRLHNVGIGHDPSRPYTLGFGPAAKLYDFLKLDETGEGPTAGWNDFFWGKGKNASELGKTGKPVRGFFNYYPVERLKPASIVLATFEGPDGSRINEGKDPQPYIVTMPYGNGKTLYIGSSETYRLRSMAKGEALHERFWIKMCRFVSAGTTAQKRFGRILLGRSMPIGDIPFEAQIKGEDLQPLAPDSRPTVLVKKIGDQDAKPATFDLKAKQTQGDWQGWFLGKYTIREPGEYEFTIPIGVGEALSHRLNVRKPNLEMDNLRHNHGALYQIATDATTLLEHLSGPDRAAVHKALGRPADEEIKESSGKETTRLFFPLPSAGAISRCLKYVEPDRQSTKGSLKDLWDTGHDTGLGPVSAYHLAMLIPGLVGLVGAALLLALRQFWGAGAFLGAALLVVGGAWLFGDPDWIELPLDISYVLIAVALLLSLEWLTRKLLKLA